MKMNKLYLYTLLALLFLSSCDPVVDDKIELGEPPTNISFIVNDLGENIFEFTNTTEGTFIHQWEFGDGQSGVGNTIMHTYSSMGDYDVKLTAFNDGGFGVSTNQVMVLEDLGLTCVTLPILESLTDCGSKTWKLDDGEGALFVGENAGVTWWQSTEDEIVTRPCAFNDEWIFFEDGTMVYDTKGDLWAEDYMGFAFECVNDGDLSDSVAPWASGEHSFTMTEEDSAIKITLSGLGAFIGLPKVVNGAEVTAPVDGITYDVVEFTNDGTNDIMLLEVNFGPGIWRFRLKSE